MQYPYTKLYNFYTKYKNNQSYLQKLTKKKQKTENRKLQTKKCMMIQNFLASNTYIIFSYYTNKFRNICIYYKLDRSYTSYITEVF